MQETDTVPESHLLGVAGDAATAFQFEAAFIKRNWFRWKIWTVIEVAYVIY